MKNLCIVIACLIAGVSHAQTLQEFQQEAAERNPGLQAKYKVFEASMQRISQVKSLPDPNLSFGYFISPVETRVGPQRARISLSQMFPWFGTLKAQQEAEVLSAEASYQMFLDAKNRLYLQVAEAYYPLVELKQLTEIEQDNIELLETYQRIATSKFENALGSMVDVLRVDIRVEELHTKLDLLKEKEYSLRTTFNQLLDRTENQEIVLTDSLEAVYAYSSIDRDSLVSQNAQISALDFQAQSFATRQVVAAKQGMPKVGVGLDYVMVGKRSDMAVDDNGKDALMPMVTVSLPVFRGKYKAAQKEAELMEESYELQRRELTNNLITSYENTRYEMDREQQLLTLYDAQLKKLHQTLSLQFTAYSNSSDGFEDLLEIQQELLAYQRKEVEARTALQKAVAKMDYIISNYK